MNIVVAMAGEGSRFIEQGHVYPKPLIRTGNTTMIQNVYYSLEWPNADWHFVVKMQHLKDYPFMKSLLESMGSITAIEETTQGAAETLQKCIKRRKIKDAATATQSASKRPGRNHLAGLSRGVLELRMDLGILFGLVDFSSEMIFS